MLIPQETRAAAGVLQVGDPEALCGWLSGACVACFAAFLGPGVSIDLRQHSFIILGGQNQVYSCWYGKIIQYPI